jgi:phospholipid N-methyltransferase
MSDIYVNDMDWSKNGNGFSSFNNYRRYQFNLISKYIGSRILEIGTGDRSFTDQILHNIHHPHSLLSIEPSEVLYELALDKNYFPDNFKFISRDLFDLDASYQSGFDTALLIHVLEHIEEDKAAIDHIHPLLADGGHLLIEVPAYQWLYSEHDSSLGHFRRYNIKSLKNIIDFQKYKLIKIWHQDPIGILGSLYFFKFKKTRLKSTSGDELLKNQGRIYNNFIIPFEEFLEKFIKFPFGLNLTLVLKKI